MKLRIRGNSIRLRLTQSEVEHFAERGLIEEAVEFGTLKNQRFIYALIISTEIEVPRAVLENNRISVLVPKSEAAQWTSTNQVGISAEQHLAEDKTLRILIEKDFACLEERPGEDESDAFPHPQIGKMC
jgi:hypothetical protein